MPFTYDDINWDDDGCQCSGCDGDCNACVQWSPYYLVPPGDHRVIDMDVTCYQLRAYLRSG